MIYGEHQMLEFCENNQELQIFPQSGLVPTVPPNI